MLKEQVVNKLNQQINQEFYSSNLYLQMSSWCAHKGLEGSAKFLKSHAAEEMRHMQRLFDYVTECGAIAKLGEIKEPPTEFESIVTIFQQTYEHEILITSNINDLVHVAFEMQDYSTFNFLQWYVAEQHEEEKLFKSILDKINIIGTEGRRGLYPIDQVIGNLDGGSVPD
ncbi:MAG: non-heme ferritin [Methylococcales bacterium]|nr:non-heme ferritin [Methylococcales bacterium]